MAKGIKIFFLACFILGAGHRYLWGDLGENKGETDLFNQGFALSKADPVEAMSPVQKLKIAHRISETFIGSVGQFKIPPILDILSLDSAKKDDAFQKIKESIARRSKDVLIESKIIQVVLSEEYKGGIDWSAIVSNYHALNTGRNNPTDNGQDKLSIGTISPEDYSVLLEALDTVGTTHILATLNVKMSNNREAKVVFFPASNTDDRYSAQAENTNATVDPENFLDLSLNLFLKAMIEQDNFISMRIKPDFESMIDPATQQKGPDAKRESDDLGTLVMIKDGGTIVIGGFIKDEKVDSFKKVPLLGDIPLIGSAFRNENQLTRRTELVVFLTPKIADDHF